MFSKIVPSLFSIIDADLALPYPFFTPELTQPIKPKAIKMEIDKYSFFSNLLVYTSRTTSTKDGDI